MAYRAANLSRQHLALERCACVGANEDSRLSRNVISERDRRSMRRMSSYNIWSTLTSPGQEPCTHLGQNYFSWLLLN